MQDPRRNKMNNLNELIPNRYPNNGSKTPVVFDSAGTENPTEIRQLKKDPLSLSFPTWCLKKTPQSFHPLDKTLRTAGFLSLKTSGPSIELIIKKGFTVRKVVYFDYELRKEEVVYICGESTKVLYSIFGCRTFKKPEIFSTRNA